MGSWVYGALWNYRQKPKILGSVRTGVTRRLPWNLGSLHPLDAANKIKKGGDEFLFIPPLAF
jgi:hypothetical protein